jgi:hypothetical protein
MFLISPLARIQRGTAQPSIPIQSAPGVGRKQRAPEAPRLDQYLCVLLRAGELAERGLDAVEADLGGDQRRRVDLALGQQTQGPGELLGRVAEHELEAELLHDAEHRLDRVLLHADADNDDAGVARRLLEGLLDEPRNAHAFEDRRACR